MKLWLYDLEKFIFFSNLIIGFYFSTQIPDLMFLKSHDYKTCVAVMDMRLTLPFCITFPPSKHLNISLSSEKNRCLFHVLTLAFVAYPIGTSYAWKGRICPSICFSLLTILLHFLSTSFMILIVLIKAWILLSSMSSFFLFFGISALFVWGIISGKWRLEKSFILVIIADLLCWNDS